MLFLLQQPVVVELSKGPQETSRIAYSDVLVSAVGVVGLIVVVAVLAGLTAGWLFIRQKKRAERDAPVEGTDHVRLRLS
jgi:hypothetical protein